MTQKRSAKVQDCLLDQMCSFIQLCHISSLTSHQTGKKVKRFRMALVNCQTIYQSTKIILQEFILICVIYNSFSHALYVNIVVANCSAY